MFGKTLYIESSTATSKSLRSDDTSKDWVDIELVYFSTATVYMYDSDTIDLDPEDDESVSYNDYRLVGRFDDRLTFTSETQTLTSKCYYLNNIPDKIDILDFDCSATVNIDGDVGSCNAYYVSALEDYYVEGYDYTDHFYVEQDGVEPEDTDPHGPISHIVFIDNEKLTEAFLYPLETARLQDVWTWTVGEEGSVEVNPEYTGFDSLDDTAYDLITGMLRRLDNVCEIPTTSENDTGEDTDVAVQCVQGVLFLPFEPYVEEVIASEINIDLTWDLTNFAYTFNSDDLIELGVNEDEVEYYLGRLYFAETGDYNSPMDIQVSIY